MAAVGSMVASGLLMTAKQVAAPPQLSSTLVPVGRRHAATVRTAVKGCRPPVKVYTDVRVEGDDLKGAQRWKNSN